MKTAIAHLNLGKSEDELNSDHVIHGSALLQKYLLTFAFNVMLSHGLSSDTMSNSTTTPILKGKG